jgi:hypothetical protein
MIRFVFFTLFCLLTFGISFYAVLALEESPIHILCNRQNDKGECSIMSFEPEAIMFFCSSTNDG